MFSGDQSFSHDRKLDLMGDEWGCIRYPFLGGLVPTRLNLVYPGQFRCFPVSFTGFFRFILGFSVFWVNLDETWNLQPLVSTSHSGPPDLDEGSTTWCLWWSLMGGEVRNMCHISRGRCEP